MNDRIHYVVMGTLLLGGCSLSEDQVDEFELLEIAESVDDLDINTEPEATPFTAAIGIDPECRDRVAPVIGHLSRGGDCDFPGLPALWVPTHLFEKGSPWVEGLSATVPDPLMRYCKYEYTGPTQDLETAYNILAGAIDAYPFMDGDTISTDCLGITPEGGLADETVVSAYNDVFRTSVGAVDDADLSGFEYDQVRVGLIDTAAAGEIPATAHATQIRGLIEDLMCPDDLAPEYAACVDSIHESLATPRTDAGTTDWLNGGQVGFATDYALATYFELQTWLDNIDPSAPERAVFNVSLGYDINGTYAKDPKRATTMAMIDVLNMAACYGGVTVAAAGNLRPGTCAESQDGLLAPAKFETLLAPTALQCAIWGYVPTWDVDDYPIFTVEDRPLVYAVGGLTENDDMIANARPNSMPRLGTYALAAAGDPTGAAILSDVTPMTGTSASAAAVTAAAALAWSIDPSVAGDVIMERIHKDGWNTSMTADDGQWAGASVHRLSICRVLQGFGLGVACPASPPNPSTVFDPIEIATAAIIASSTPIVSKQVAMAAPMCEQPDFAEVVVPQPNRPVCGWCTADIGLPTTSGDDHVDMTIDYEGWPAATDVETAYLDILNTDDSVTTIDFLPALVQQINTAQSTDIITVYFHAPDMARATLVFNYTDLSTQSHSLPVL